MNKQFNEFELFLNECQTYVWEWYVPEQKVRFGIPSLNSLWTDDASKDIKLATMLERVHPDDIQKVLVRHTSPLYKSDRMFEVDLRLNVAPELKPDGQSSGEYEWYGFRGKIVKRDEQGRPTYLRGIAINLDLRYRAQMKLFAQKERQMQNLRQQLDYSTGIIQEVNMFIRNLAENANALISTDGPSGAEDRMMHLAELKDKGIRLLELTDKFRLHVGDIEPAGSNEIHALSLWEHFAELQQVYSLKAGSRLKFYFSNLYDTVQLYVDTKLFDLLLDNVINPQFRTQATGTVTMSYVADPNADRLTVSITCSGMNATVVDTTTSYTESGLGLSVCRLIAKRLYGDIQVEQHDPARLKYIITLPLDGRKAAQRNAYKRAAGNNESDEGLNTDDTLDELKREHEARALQQRRQRAALPQVLIGLRLDTRLYSNQHLFEVSLASTTDEVFEAFRQNQPDIVFIDSSLPGKMRVFDLIARLHEAAPALPIIITDDYGQRSLHKQVQRLGARYMLNNPLSLRKVNVMIKKYLR